MRRRPSYVLIAAAFALTASTAYAEPTVAECLAASDASANLARDHKLLAERAQLLVCAAASCPLDIRKDCVSHVDEVNGQIPTIIFEAKNGGGADINAVKVTMDGQPFTEKLDGTALSVDPGEHSFTFETAGQPAVARSFTIQQSQKDRHEAVTLGPLPAPPPTVPAPAAGPRESAGLGTQRIIALATGGVGLAGVAVGAAFGAIAISDKSSAESECRSATCPTAAGSDKWSSAAKAGNVSTISFIVGGVALAGGATLWFTAGRGAPKAQVGLGPGMLQLRRSW